jgi:hypothetical protein
MRARRPVPAAFEPDVPARARAAPSPRWPTDLIPNLDILQWRAPLSAVLHRSGGRAGAQPVTDVKQLRAPLRDDDRVLVSETHVWLRRIPGRLQPKQLCRFYPRVANRLARCWHDTVAFETLVQDLLVDRRGGRAGFPPRIVVELQVLRQFRERHLDPSWRKRLRGYAITR